MSAADGFDVDLVSNDDDDDDEFRVGAATTGTIGSSLDGTDRIGAGVGLDINDGVDGCCCC